MKAVESKALTLRPEIHVPAWNRWLEDGRDWCISRQLWWGFRIPVWFATIASAPAKENDDSRWISAHSEAEALDKAAKRFNVDKNQITLKQGNKAARSLL